MRGIIPAYAGNTEGFRLGACCGRDHPRVCGEHLRFLLSIGGVRGSSPRMRGTPLLSIGPCVGTGIIPAYAGNTVPVQTIANTIEDHPRVCGEHHQAKFSKSDVVGSSPRMRGTHDVLRLRTINPGIIPAYAGNTCLPIREMLARRDHPRVCGEHRFGLLPHRRATGSSPRMRGTH